MDAPGKAARQYTIPERLDSFYKDDKARILVRPMLRSSAIHEAGHAAVDWFFGQKVVEIKMFRGGGRIS